MPCTEFRCLARAKLVVIRGVSAFMQLVKDQRQERAAPYATPFGPGIFGTVDPLVLTFNDVCLCLLSRRRSRTKEVRRVPLIPQLLRSAEVSDGPRRSVKDNGFLADP